MIKRDKQIAITITNEEELLKVLQVLEKHWSCLWASGDLPTDLYPSYKELIKRKGGFRIFISIAGTLTSGAVREEDIEEYVIYSAKVFLSEINNSFSKSDLKPGMLVRTAEKEDDLYLIIGDRLVQAGDSVKLSYYDKNLKTIDRTIDSLDIIEVYSGKDIYSLIRLWEGIVEENLLWKREVVVEMTIAEIEEKLGIKNLKIIGEK